MATDLRAVARRTLQDIFPAADAQALAEVVHPDVIAHDLPSGLPAGREGMIQVMRMLNRAFSELRYDIHHVIAEDELVAIHCTMRGRHTGDFMGLPATDRTVAVAQLHLVRFEHGKGKEHWAVRDDLSMLRQLGALPAPSRAVAHT